MKAAQQDQLHPDISAARTYIDSYQNSGEFLSANQLYMWHFEFATFKADQKELQNYLSMLGGQTKTKRPTTSHVSKP